MLLPKYYLLTTVVGRRVTTHAIHDHERRHSDTRSATYTPRYCGVWLCARLAACQCRARGRGRGASMGARPTPSPRTSPAQSVYSRKTISRVHKATATSAHGSRETSRGTTVHAGGSLGHATASGRRAALAQELWASCRRTCLTAHGHKDMVARAFLAFETANGGVSFYAVCFGAHCVKRPSVDCGESSESIGN